MTLSSSTSEETFIGNGATVFDLPFRFFSNNDIVATLIDTTLNATFPLVLGVDYTLSGAGEPEADGNPVSQLIKTTPLAVGFSMLVQRIMPVTQPVDFVNQGRFFAETHEDGFDRTVMLIQQGSAAQGNTMQLTPTRDRWDARGFRIINVGDPIDPQDAATRNWAEQFIADILATGQGPINNAANVIYAFPDGTIKVVQDLSNFADLSKGAAGIARADRHVDNVTNLVGLVGRYSGDALTTTSYWPGWGGSLIGPVGGARFVWDPTRPKSQHNAGNIVSPTVPWAGTEATFAAYIAKSGETNPGGTGCWVHENIGGNQFNVLQWGAKNDATNNGANNAMIQPLLNYVEAAVGGGFGGIVNFPRGNYRFTTYFNIRDRTTIRGEGPNATVLQWQGTTPGNCVTLGPVGPNHPTQPPGHYVFACRIERMALSAGNAYKGSEASIVYTDGAHEHSGIFECTIRDFVSWGVFYNTGNGGPAHFEIKSLELFASDTLPTIGTRNGIVCNAGGALISLKHITVTGGPTNKLDWAVRMLKDHLVATSIHVELCNGGVGLFQNDAVNQRANVINGITGNVTVGSNGLVDIQGSFQGSVTVNGAINKSASGTGLITLINRANGGEQFLDQPVATYSHPKVNGEADATARLLGTTGAITRAHGRPFTSTKTATGTYRVTLTATMPNTDYVVIPSARTGGVDTGCTWAPVSGTQFDIFTRNQAGALTDADQVWFALYRN